MYSVRLIMLLRGLRHRDLLKILPSSTLHNILTASQNVSKNTLNRLEPILQTGGNIQFLFALDRLHYLAEKSGISINTDFVKFPESLPEEIVNILRTHHPAFIQDKLSKSNLHNSRINSVQNSHNPRTKDNSNILEQPDSVNKNC